MRFSMHRSALLELLSAPASLAMRAQVDRHACLLIEVDDSHAKFSANDMVTGIETSGDAFVEESGKTLVSAKSLFNAIKSLPDQSILMSLENGKLIVKADRSVFEMKTLDASLYDPFPDMKSDGSVTVPADTLAGLIKSGGYAASKDPDRYVLMAIRLKVEDGRLIVTSCDSYRIAESEYEVDSEDFCVLAPVHIFDGMPSTGDITVSANRNQVKISGEGFKAVTRSIEGTYPNTDAVWPSSNGFMADIDRRLMASVVKRVDSVTGSKGIKLDAEGDGVSISKKSETEDAHDQISADIHAGSVLMCVNGRFLTDALSHMTADLVTIETDVSGLKPMVIKAGESRSLIMPVRL